MKRWTIRTDLNVAVTPFRTKTKPSASVRYFNRREGVVGELSEPD